MAATTTMKDLSMMALALLASMCVLVHSAPLTGSAGPMQAEEMQLSNLMKDIKAGGTQGNSKSFNSPLGKEDHMPQTKVLLQKTKIVIPIDDEKEIPAAAPVPVAPKVQAPVAQQEEEEPMRFVDPPQMPVDNAFTPEENQFLFPADYQLNAPEPQYPEEYEDEEAAAPEQAPAPVSPDLDLTPRAVAEYLVLTGDFKGFDDALNDLMNAGMLTLSQVEQYQYVVGREYERLVGEMALAEEEYEQEQLAQAQVAQAQVAAQEQALYGALQSQQGMRDEVAVQEELAREAEAGELLQALLQDYLLTENVDANTQEYEDFINWMEKSLDDKAGIEEEPMLEDVESQEIQQAQSAPEVVDVADELEQLPVQETEEELKEEESSGDLEAELPQSIVVPGQLSSTEKKLKKALEAAH